MRLRSKAALYISSALMVCIGLETVSQAMQQEKAIGETKSLTDLPPQDRTSRQGFLDYLQRRHVAGEITQEQLERARQELSSDAGWLRKAPNVLLELRASMGATQAANLQAQQQLAAERARAEAEQKRLQQEVEQQKQRAQGAEQQAAVARQREAAAQAELAQFQALNAGQVQHLQAQFQQQVAQALDSLYLAKFWGDQNKDYKVFLEKITKQALASQKLKEGYESDLKIVKLADFLNYPSKPGDVKPLYANLDKDEKLLSQELMGKVQALQAILTEIFQIYDRVAKDQQVIQLPTEKHSKILKYQPQFEKDGKLRDAVEQLMGKAQAAAQYLANVNPRIEENVKHLENLKAHIDVDDVSTLIIGKIEAKGALAGQAVGLNALAFIMDLEKQIKEGNLPGNLPKDLTIITENLDKIRVLAYEILGYFGSASIQFDVHKHNANLSQFNLAKLIEDGKKIISMEETNALIENLGPYRSDTNPHEIDYHKLSEYKNKTDVSHRQLFTKFKLLGEAWNKNLKEKKKFFDLESKASKTPEGIITQIADSDLVVPKKGAKKPVANKLFPELDIQNRETQNSINSVLKKAADTGTAASQFVETQIGAMIVELSRQQVAKFDQAIQQHPQPLVQQVLGKLKAPEKKDDFLNKCRDAFDEFKNFGKDNKVLYGLFEKIIIAHEAHMDLIQKVDAAKLALVQVKPHLPQHAQPEIATKVAQLEQLFGHPSGVYLEMVPNLRAMYYAYNLLMISDADLQAIDPKSDALWGNVAPALVKATNEALYNAYQAYISARDAIKAIQPVPAPAGGDTIKIGGFEEPAPAVHPQGSAPASPQLGHAGPPPPPTPPPFGPPHVVQQGVGGPPPPPPPPPPPLAQGVVVQHGGQGAPPPPPGGVPVVAVQAAPAKDAVKLACNTCAAKITAFVKDSIGAKVAKEKDAYAEKLYGLKLDEAKTQGAVDAQKDAELKKDATDQADRLVEKLLRELVEQKYVLVLNDIKPHFVENFTYMDAPALKVADVLGMIENSCGKVMDTAQVQRELKGIADQIEEKTTKAKLSAVAPQGGAGAQQGAPGQGMLKKRTPPAQAAKAVQQIEATEEELLKLGDNVDAAQAKHKRLVRIKELIDGKLGAGNAEKFADEELLAFPVHVFFEIKPEALKKDEGGFDIPHHGKRRFSIEVLSNISKNRFGSREDMKLLVLNMKSHDLVNDDPEAFLRNKLSFGTNLIQSLKKGGHLR